MRTCRSNDETAVTNRFGESAPCIHIIILLSSSDVGQTIIIASCLELRDRVNANTAGAQRFRVTVVVRIMY